MTYPPNHLTLFLKTNKLSENFCVQAINKSQKPILLWPKTYARNVSVTFSLATVVNLPLSTSMNRSVFHFLPDAAQRFLLLETTLLFLSQAQSRESNHQSRL